jgi:hypothetical protein
MKNKKNNISEVKAKIILIHIYPIILSPIRGGGDYRGIYDIGLKGALEGYIGLLLNAPYKIDRLMWMRLMMMSFEFLLFNSLLDFSGLYERRVFLGVGTLKCRYLGF